MISSFLVNGIVFSIINTFGILFVKLKGDLEKAGDEDAAFKCGNKVTLLKKHSMVMCISIGWLLGNWLHLSSVILCWYPQ